MESERGLADSSPEWFWDGVFGWVGVEGREVEGGMELDVGGLRADEDGKEADGGGVMRGEGVDELRCKIASSTFLSNSSFVMFDNELKSIVSTKDTAPIYNVIGVSEFQ